MPPISGGTKKSLLDGAKVARLVGGAGTGKTHRLMDTLDKVIAAGVDADEIGFVTFTRAARAEAVSRACDRLMVPPRVLEQKGWFRTLHSIAYKLLGCVPERLLTDTAESRRWVAEAIQSDVEALGGALDEAAPYEARTRADKVLAMWSASRCARARVDNVLARLNRVDPAFSDTAEAKQMIARYEEAKQRDDRVDFTDLLSRVAGLRFTVDGEEQVEPEGESPKLGAWFHDEMQDTSPLADAVFRRLIDNHRTRWVYVSGDPFQSIYQFAGADPTCFMGMPVDKQEVMKQSYRCGAKILAMGERILRQCSDYEALGGDRGIAPAPHADSLDKLEMDALQSEVNPHDGWLVLARTNRIARDAVSQLDDACIPWIPTSGKGGWQPSIKTRAINTMAAMQRREPIRPEDWVDVCKTLKTTGKLDRGTKKFWTEAVSPESLRDLPACTESEYVSAFGVLPEYLEKISSGEWTDDIAGASRYLYAVHHYGQDIVDHPRVKVGTIHSVKGAEGDNVALLTSTSSVIQRSMDDQAEKDAEQRVWYVGVTRARHRLTLFVQKEAKFKKGLPFNDS